MQAAIDASLDDLRRWIPWAGEEPMPVEKKTELLAAFQANFLARRDAAYVLIDRADDSFTLRHPLPGFRSKCATNMVSLWSERVP